MRWDTSVPEPANDDAAKGVVIGLRPGQEKARVARAGS
jgi:hypothetical protein